MRSFTNTCLLGALLSLGCDTRDAPQRSSSRAADDSSAAVSDSAAGGFAARVPDSVLVRRGACPFECCIYGDWALEADAVVRMAPNTNAGRVFTLSAQQRFRADSGFVRITGRQFVAVHDTVDQRPYAERFLPGDTLLVLDYVGEGHFNVWTGRRVVDVEGFWGAEARRPVAELLGRYEREWWVHVSWNQEQGWLLVQPPMRLIGADACGVPPPWRSGR